MLDLITAIYENGVLRPITPLALPEHSRVQLQIQAPPAQDSPAEHRRRVHEVLVAAGLSLPRPPVPPGAKPLSAERREALTVTVQPASPQRSVQLTAPASVWIRSRVPGSGTPITRGSGRGDQVKITCGAAGHRSATAAITLMGAWSLGPIAIAPLITTLA